ncbi:MAG: TetR family transcriptional regulator [Pseudonocardiaceae bacterium]|nr:TetR family transcriptional regulator [Pseudonocardiaceae bacterium]
MTRVSTDHSGPQYGPQYSGSGDPKRSIELLWGIQERPKRGPKPRLTVERIARAGIEVADAEGLAALSMRQVADRVGVGTMSLYTYVPGKAELIDVMLDTVYGELVAADEVPGGWRAKLEHVARQNWALFHRHPWTLQVAASRPALGPNATTKYDYELRAVEGIGLTDLEMDAVVSLIVGHAEGAARRAVDAAEAERRTGLTDLQWWEAYSPLLDEVVDANQFATAARVGQAAGTAYGAAHDFEYGFEFGLQRVLDGIEGLVRGRGS